MKANHSSFKIGFPAIILQFALVFLIGSLSSCVDDGEESFKKDYGVYIEYKEDGTVGIINPVSDGGVTITTEGHQVYVQSKANDVTYFLSGSTTNGTFRIISGEHSQNIVLNGVSIKNTNGGAINILSKKKTYIVLATGTENYLEDGNVLEDESKGVLFSEGKLSFSGKGMLTIAGNARHGICSDDYLEVHSGIIRVQRAPKDGMHVHDYIAIYGGELNITAQSDGMDCDRGYIDIYDGTINITSGKKGIATTSDSASLDRHIRILNGTIKISSLSTVENDSTGYGLRSAGNLYIEGGDIVIDTQKKGISAGKSVSIAGGEDDDNDNDEDESEYEPKELYIWGGTITCTGTVRPEENLGTQNCLYYVARDNFSKNTTFNLIDVATNTQVMWLKNAYKVKKIFFSSPEIETGKSYKIIRTGGLLHQFNNISDTFTPYHQ